VSPRLSAARAQEADPAARADEFKALANDAFKGAIRARTLER
jgi:hypothetical protein